MIEEHLEEIEKHFSDWYPAEGCGVLAVQKGKVKWFPCTNVAFNEEDFIIDSKEYLQVSRNADIIGIVHSHPDVSCEPTESDIKYCNATKLNYYIFSYPSMEMYLLEPKLQEKPLIGRQYEFGVNDCFEALRDYLETKNIIIPPRALFEDNWWSKDGLNYFCDEIISTYNHKNVTGQNLQENDVLTFTIESHVPNHCAVYIGNDLMFHHAMHRISCRENLYPFWKKFISGVYRYAA